MDLRIVFYSYNISDYISTICYIIPTQTLWISANSTEPVIYDPRSGLNVSEFVESPDATMRLQSSNNNTPNSNQGYPAKSKHPASSAVFKQFCYMHDTDEIVGISNRRAIHIWRYETTSPLGVLQGHEDNLECIAYSIIKLPTYIIAAKEPILIFTCGEEAIINKWERLQLNTFMYGQESINLSAQIIEPIVHTPTKKFSSILDGPSNRKLLDKPKMKDFIQKLKQFKSYDTVDEHSRHVNITGQIELLSAETQRIFKRTLTTMMADKESASTKLKNDAGYQSKKHSITRMLYHEELDYLVCASFDGCLCKFSSSHWQMLLGMIRTSSSTSHKMSSTLKILKMIVSPGCC
jgi:hypothetical protein